MNANCYCQPNVEIYLGTTPKYLLDIMAEMPMADFDFDVKLVGEGGEILLHKADMPTDAEGNYYVCFDTEALGAGVVKAVVSAFIPDTAFNSGYRTEVYVINRFAVILDA